MRYTRNLFEDVTYRISGNEIRTAMGCDVVVTGAAEHAGFDTSKGADGTWLNEYGMRLKQGPVYVEVLDHPLKEIQSTAEADAYCFPDPDAPERVEKFISLCKKTWGLWEVLKLCFSQLCWPRTAGF